MEGGRALCEVRYSAGNYKTAQGDSCITKLGSGNPTCYWCNKLLLRGSKAEPPASASFK